MIQIGPGVTSALKVSRVYMHQADILAAVCRQFARPLYHVLGSSHNTLRTPVLLPSMYTIRPGNRGSRHGSRHGGRHPPACSLSSGVFLLPYSGAGVSHSHLAVSSATAAVARLESSGCASRTSSTPTSDGSDPASTVTVGASCPTGMDGKIEAPGTNIVPSAGSAVPPAVLLAGTGPGAPHPASAGGGRSPPGNPHHGVMGSLKYDDRIFHMSQCTASGTRFV